MHFQNRFETCQNFLIFPAESDKIKNSDFNSSNLTQAELQNQKNVLII